MNTIATAAAGGESDGQFVGTVKEFPEIRIVGTTLVAVRARAESQVKKAIEERRARGEKIPAKKLKLTLVIKKQKKE